MVETIDIFYWDACIFYEHLNEEQVDQRKRQAIDDLLRENKEKRNRICTSVITHIEVIPKKLEKSKEKIYWEKFQSMYFYDIEVDRNVITLSREIRNYYFSPGDRAVGGTYKILSTGDAFHLATAIIHQVTELHTRDKNSKGGNIPLLGLPEASPNGKICGIHSLRVLSPEVSQGRLDGV
jgi:predicted nucleic acid-binding protein